MDAQHDREFQDAHLCTEILGVWPQLTAQSRRSVLMDLGIERLSLSEILRLTPFGRDSLRVAIMRLRASEQTASRQRGSAARDARQSDRPTAPYAMSHDDLQMSWGGMGWLPDCD